MSATTRINMPWLYDKTGDIIGIKDEDGGEMYFRSLGQSGADHTGDAGGSVTNITVINQAQPGSVYLQWLQSLQYTDEGTPAFGAIRWHDSPATRKGDDAYYKIEPYFAHLAMYYALEVAPDHFGVMAKRWLNWWMGNVSVTTKTALIHYANKDGSVCVSALPGADPVVPVDNEDATDSNAALFLLLLARYLSLFGPEGLNEDWPSKVQIVYDGLIAVRDTDDLTWAKTSYPIKYLMDNVEVWAGLGAAVLLLQLLGDTQRRDAAQAWRATLKQAIGQTYWQEASGTWSHSMDGSGTVMHSDLSKLYPDALCQLWPALFGMDVRGGYAGVATQWPQWPVQAIDPGGALHPQIAMAAAQAGNLEQAQSWLVAVAAKCREGNSFRWPFTCADAAVCSWVASAPKVQQAQGVADALAAEASKQIEAVRLSLGSASDLKTNEKGTVVGAVNELKTKLDTMEPAAVGASINDGSASAATAYSSEKVEQLIAAAKVEVKSDLLDGAPAAFDTLKEIAAYVAQDQSAGTALIEKIGALDAKASATQDDLNNEKLVMMGYNQRITALEEQSGAQDTGWRDIKQELVSMKTSTGATVPFSAHDVFAFRRIGDRGFVFISYMVVNGADRFVGLVPECFRPARDLFFPQTASSSISPSAGVRMFTNGQMVATHLALNMRIQNAMVIEYIPQGDFPSVIPGVAWDRTAA